MSFCHNQKRSSHLISQNSSPHARHVSLDGVSVTIKVLEPDQNAAICRFFLSQNAGGIRICYDMHGQNARISRIFS